MNFDQFTKKLLKDPKFKEEYEKENIADNIIDARLKAGLTQKELAKKIGTKQSSIARLESENSRPSLSFLDKIAKALRTELVDPTFTSIQKERTKIEYRYIYNFLGVGGSDTRNDMTKDEKENSYMNITSYNKNI